MNSGFRSEVFGFRSDVFSNDYIIVMSMNKLLAVCGFCIFIQLSPTTILGVNES